MTTKRVFFLVVLVLAVIALLLRQREGTRFATGSKQLQQIADARAVTLSSVPALVRSLRPNYPYSIIPGGAYSREEFLRWVRRDAVVQRHYEGFNGQAVRLITAGQDLNVYVSYRKQDQVFWTNKRLLIPRGELLISDGVHMARARCGNRLADTRPPGGAENTTEPRELGLPPFTLAMYQRGIVPSVRPEITGPPVFPSSLVPALPSALVAFTPPVPFESPSASGAYLLGSGLPLATPLPMTKTLSGATSSGSGSSPSGTPDDLGNPRALVPEPGCVGAVGLLFLMIGLGLRRSRWSGRRSPQVGSTSSSTFTE